MIILLSPAKSLDYDTAVPDTLPHTTPQYMREAGELVDVLKQKSPQDLMDLMGISENLAQLNAHRYAAWRQKPSKKNVKQAVLAFNGDVYDGLDAKSLTPDQLDWAQSHVVSLSGLYGALRPLDMLQPYRLEMGTALRTPRGKNLYQFWGSEIAEYLNKRLKTELRDSRVQHVESAMPVVLNLASQEYFKVVDTKVLRARVIECVFEEHKNGAYKVIGFMAKKARGMMTRFAIEHRIADPEQLKAFGMGGYAFAAKASAEHRWVFRRKT